jgi:NCS1 family nucleobase:cation symporter-1
MYGIQGVLGGTAVLAMLTAMSPSFAQWHAGAIPNSIGITAPGMIAFWVFWIASFPLLFLSVPTLRWIFIVKIAIVPFFWTAMFTWGLTAGNGWGPLFQIPNKITSGFSVPWAFFYCMSAAIGGNATFALNMADVCRYSKNTREGWQSQLWAGPLFMSLTELLGAILGATSQIVYGQVLFNPVSVILLWNNRPAKFFAGLILAF